MYQTEYPSAAPAFYDLSTHKSEDAPFTSPYWIGTVAVPSTDRSSSLSPRSLLHRDIGNNTNFASLIGTYLIGMISIGLQAKGISLQTTGNSIAAASYRVALAVAANAVEGVASGMINAGTSAISARVNSTGEATSRIDQAGTNNVVGGVSGAMGGASRWFPSVPSSLAAISPFVRSSPNAPADEPDPDNDERESEDRNADGVFVIGSDTNSESGDNVALEEGVSLTILDHVAMTENPWAEDNDNE